MKKNQSHDTANPADRVNPKRQTGAAATSPRRGWDRFESGYIHIPFLSVKSTHPTP
jgi:hypothetical protein